MELFKNILNFLNSPQFMGILRASYYLLLVFVVALWLSLVVWTYRDALKRGTLAFFWMLVVLLFSFPGWVIYLILRPPEFEEEATERELEIRYKQAILEREGLVCPACLRPVDSDFLICPYCFKKLKKECPHCKRALKMDWTVCPYCKTSL